MTVQLPDGPVTLMFTDVEGSTAMRTSLGDDRANVILRDHDALIREQLAACGGLELSTTGDGFLLAFTSVKRAIACAVQIQKRISAYNREQTATHLRVRIGLNTGEVSWDGDEVSGEAVHAAERVCGEARGVGILVSNVTKELAGTLPDIDFVDRGEATLKGFPAPWHLWQVTEQARSDESRRRAPPIIGRDDEIAALRGALFDARDGRGRVVVLEGEAGIGKSRLLETALDAARELDLQIAIGRGHELERERPFGPFVDAFALDRDTEDEQRSELASILRIGANELSGVAEEAEAQFSVADRFADLVESVAVRRALVLAIEDIHWADALSIRTLHRIAKRVSDLPALILCTTRPTPHSADLETFLQTVAGGDRIVVGPLDGDEIGELIRSALGAPPGPHLLAKAAGAAGNPLFVSELLAALSNDGSIETVDGSAEVEEGSLPPSLALTVLRRLAFLSDEALEVLRLASAFGTSFSPRDLSIVMGRPALELLPAIEEAQSASLVTGSGTRLSFRHDLVREAVYQDMLVPIRRALHIQIGLALRDAKAPLTQVATHMALGAEAGDTQAIDLLEHAAAEMVAASPPAAVELLSKAVALAEGSDPSRRGELEVALAYARIAADQLMDAEQAARDGLSRPVTTAVRTEGLRALAVSMTRLGRYVEAAEVLEPWVAEDALPPAERALILAEYGRCCVNFDLDRAEPAIDEAIDLGKRTGNNLAVVTASIALSLRRALQGRVTDALRMTDEARQRAAKIDRYDPPGSRVTEFRWVALLYGEQFDDLEASLETWRRSSDAGSPGSVADYHYTLAHALIWSGRWDEGISEAEAGLRVTEEAGRETYELLLRQLLIYVSIHRDDLSTAESQLSLLRGGAWARALFAEAQSDDARLKEVLDTYVETSVRSPRPWHMPQMWWVGPDWVRWYVAAGDRSSAETLTEVVEEGARLSGLPTAQGAAFLCRGLLEGDSTVLRQSVEAYRSSPRLLERALACEDAARALPAADADEAVNLLQEAMSVYESIGAARDAARAEAQLRNFGVKRGRRGPRRRPKAGWESLTETELKVAALVEEGLSYREIGQRLFISKRTVETHVAHVFGKLTLGSRRELAEVVRQRSA